jgi:hypothetical protein
MSGLMRTVIAYFFHFCMKTPSLLRRLNIATSVGLIVLTASVSSTALFAAATSNFQFTINPGTLTVDIVDASYVSV